MPSSFIIASLKETVSNNSNSKNNIYSNKNKNIGGINNNN
jgi:hypothetical protein